MSCDDMYVCENGIRLPSCKIKIMMDKCDKFQTTQDYEAFMKKKEREKVSFNSVFDQTEKCLFCGKPRHSDWQSSLVCIGKGRYILFLVTVCPDDRKKHTIDDLYSKALEGIRQKAKDLVDEGQNL